MYYAMYNEYGSETDVGFANTWAVVAFDGRAERDGWVAAHATRRDVYSLTRREALRYADPACVREWRWGYTGTFATHYRPRNLRASGGQQC